MRDDRLHESAPLPAREASDDQHQAPVVEPDQQAPPPSAEASRNPDPSTQASKLHARIRALVRIERQAVREIAAGMAAMQHERLYCELGYAGLVEYGEQAFGFKPGKTRQLARLGRLLPDLPTLDAALRAGALGWTKARTIGQVATAETEAAWVERALQVTSRELEDLVSRASEGDAPPDPAEEWEPPRHIWARFRLDPFHFERLMQALALLRHKLDDPHMSASQLLLYMAELCIDGDLPAEDGGTGARETHPEDPRNVASEEDLATTHMCCEDATDEGTPLTTHVCREDAVDKASDHGEQLLPQLPRGENAYPINYRIIEHRCPSCEKAWTEGRAGRIELDERDRAMAECDAEVVAGDDSAGTPGHMNRTIPPAIRRAVLIRDGGRCQVPGCRHKNHIELHHIVPWATSRSHDPQLLVSVCWTHHAMIHKEVLHVRRDQNGELHWKRGFGEPLAVVASVWGEQGELEHSDLREFEGPPGSWPLLRGLWGPIEPPEPERVPRGRQQVRIGDDQAMAPSWMARNIPV